MSDKTKKDSVDLGRRRLTNVGLAGSVLLASLVSKNALANVPYHCSVSGKVSGNDSRHGPNPNNETSCELGDDAATVKGNLLTSSDMTKFPSIFNKPIYAKVTGSDIEVSFSQFSNGIGEGSINHATFYQVLAATKTASDISLADLEFCRAAVVLYENATTDRTQYPLTKSDVQGMFNAAINAPSSTAIVYSGSTSAGAFGWTADDIRTYFDLLYR